MKTHTKKLIIWTVVIITITTTIYYYFNDGGSDFVELIKLIFLKIGNLILIGIFLKKVKESGTCIRKIVGLMSTTFVGGGWLLQFTSIILENILRSIL